MAQDTRPLVAPPPVAQGHLVFLLALDGVGRGVGQTPLRDTVIVHVHEPWSPRSARVIVLSCR